MVICGQTLASVCQTTFGSTYPTFFPQVFHIIKSDFLCMDKERKILLWTKKMNAHRFQPTVIRSRGILDACHDDKS
jgi:hypothetical protein